MSIVKSFASIGLTAIIALSFASFDVLAKKPPDNQGPRNKQPDASAGDPYQVQTPQQEMNREFLEYLDFWQDVHKAVVMERCGPEHTQRECAFASLNEITYGILGPIALAIPVSFTALGTAAGAMAGGVSAPVGAGIGFASGVATDIPIIVGALVFHAAGSMYVNSKYPHPDAEPTATLRASPLYATYSNSDNRGGFIRTANIQGASPQLTQTTRSDAGSVVKYAGPHESMAVHFIDTFASKEIIDLARLWDQLPGLNQEQQAKLREINFLRPYIESVAYIKQNKRISPQSLPAQPIASFLSNVKRFLEADSAVVQQAWLTYFGLHSFNVNVRDGAAILDTPPPLQQVGAPPQLSSPAPGINVKFPLENTGGLSDPYIKAQLSPGPFNIKFGNATVVSSGEDAGRIKITFSISEGAALSSGSLVYKMGQQTENAEKNIPGLPDFTSRLKNSLYGYLYYDVVGHGLVLQRIHVPSMNIDLGMPQLPDFLVNVIPGLDDFASIVQSRVESILNILSNTDLLNVFNTYPVRSLERELRKTPREYGVIAINRVENLITQAGVLGAEVDATVYSGPDYSGGINIVAQANQRYRSTMGDVKATATTTTTTKATDPVSSGYAPVINGIQATQAGYIIHGQKFGSNPAAIQVIENGSTLAPGQIAGMTDSRVDIISKTVGRIAVQVVKVGQKSNLMYLSRITTTSPTITTTTSIRQPITSSTTSAPVASATIQPPTTTTTIQQAAPTVTAALAAVSRVTPLNAVIYPGQRVIITLEGQSLNTLSAVRIRQSGRDAPGFRTTIEPASTTTQSRRRITVEAASTAALGNYQLALIAGRQSVTVPSGTVVSVVAPRTILQPKTVLEPKTTITPMR